VKRGVEWEAMRLAYVMINAEVGAEGGVLEEVRGIPEVKEAYLIHGVYDIIVRVEADTIQGINDVVLSKIRSINKVRSILTMVCT
jgi:DNA-binding Lrp family transcriptional regulator